MALSFAKVCNCNFFLTYWQQKIPSGNIFGDNIFAVYTSIQSQVWSEEIQIHHERKLQTWDIKCTGIYVLLHKQIFCSYLFILDKQVRCSYLQMHLNRAFLHHNPLMQTPGLSTVCCDTVRQSCYWISFNRSTSKGRNRSGYH